jgi:hypothetical protein
MDGGKPGRHAWLEQIENGPDGAFLDNTNAPIVEPADLPEGNRAQLESTVNSYGR